MGATGECESLTRPVALLRSSHGEKRNPFWLNGTEKTHRCIFSLQARGLRYEEILVGGAGFEPATPWMSTKYSNQLN
jgi:hypothetical protein